MPLKIYQYSQKISLNISQKRHLKKIQKHFLCSKKSVVYPDNVDRRVHNSNDPNDITDDNIDDRIAKFANQLSSKFVYRIPIRYFCDLGKINFPVKIDMKIRCTLETEMKNLFESKKKLLQLVCQMPKLFS